MSPPKSNARSPELSIVIPTYRREVRLSFLLDALAEQSVARDRYEVIVVRDSEDPPLTKAPEDLEVRWLTVPAPGPAKRRNAGWRAARAPLVAFTDDDCRPSPRWVEALLAAYDDGEEVILQGSTLPDPDEAHLLYGTARSMRVAERDRWYPTCNLSMPKALLERLGGFDEDLAFFGEDTDLGLRAERLGVRLDFVEEALVWHAVHVRPIQQALRDATERHSEAAVLARYPEHRRELYLGVFVSVAHARWTLAALGLVLWPRSRIAALAAAYPYVSYKARRRIGRRRKLNPLTWARFAVDLAGEATIDGTEVVMRARSSARHRQLVL